MVAMLVFFLSYVLITSNVGLNQKQDTQCSPTHNAKFGRVRNNFFRGNVILHIRSVCLQHYLSSIQCACALLYCNLWPIWLYYISGHYLINYTVFGKKVTENRLCVFIASTTFFETSVVLRRIQQCITTSAHRSSCK
jgi:hypothetical protein